MKWGFVLVLLGLLSVACGTEAVAADRDGLQLPGRIKAGDSLAIRTRGAGEAVLYIVGPGQALRRNIQRGQTVSLGPGELHQAGHYLVCLDAAGSPDPTSAEKAEFDVVPAAEPASLSFLAKPSRLPAHQVGGISGVAYVFDVFRNLILEPLPVSFQLSDSAGAIQSQSVSTRNGIAWVKMNSAAKSGAARFQASAGAVAENRAIQQVPGEPCNIRMNAQRSGARLVLETEPVHDCGGNPVSDGTIVTFTETRNGHSEATVDVPLKRGIARTQMPALDGAVVSVASGVAIGNEVRLGVLP